MRGGVEWQMQHEVKPSAVFARDPTLSVVFFHTSQVNGALTDLLFCVGRINSSSSDGSGQICISNGLLPQAGWGSYIKHCIMVNLRYKTISA